MSVIALSRSGSIITSILLVAALGSIANALVALGAVSLGVAANGMPLQPFAYITVTVVAAIAGALGWRLINTRAEQPGRVFAWLVPTTLLLSFVPDVIMGAVGAWPWSLVVSALVMHIVTISVAVTVYRWQMPVRGARS